MSDFLASVVSGLLGSGLDAYYSREARKDDYAQQDRTNQNRISWAVADAKRAGIHPLYALGAPPMSAGGNVSATNFTQGLGQAGAAIDNAHAARREEKAQAMRDALAARESEARINASNADAALALAQAKKLEQTSPDLPIRQATSSLVSRANQKGVAKKDAAPQSRSIHTPVGVLKTGPHTPAQEVSDEYGDLVESAYGLWRLGYDGVKAAWPYWVKAVMEYPQNRKRLMKPWEK